MFIPISDRLLTIPSPSMAQHGSLYDFGSLVPPTKEPVHPPPTLETRDLLKSMAKHGGKAFGKYAQKAKNLQAKHPGAASKVAAKGFVFKSWMMWLGAGIIIVVILLLICFVWKKRDSKWQAQREEDAKPVFGWTRDGDVDPEAVHFAQPWAYKSSSERRALNKADECG